MNKRAQTEQNHDGIEHRKQPRLGQEPTSSHLPPENSGKRCGKHPSTSSPNGKALDVSNGYVQSAAPSKAAQSSKSSQTTEFYVSCAMILNMSVKYA